MEQEQNGTQDTSKAVTVLDDYSVIVERKEALQAFFADGKNLDGLYAVIEKKALGLVADVTTKEGISQVKSCARQLASVKKKVDDIGKTVVAELKALPKVIDANRAAFRDRMEALQDEIRRPVTEIEEREARIDAIKSMHIAVDMCGSDAIRAKLDEVKAIVLDEATWKESLDKAKKAVEGEANALATMLQVAEKREAEARELEELRKKQEEADRIIREQKIREEAANRAREEAEARAAAEKARLEREKAEAERRAAEAEKARQEAQERAEKAAIGMATKATADVPSGNAGYEKGQASSPSVAATPSRWTPEMKAVNNAIVKAIAGILAEIIAGHTESGYELAAKAVVKAIVTGKIRNIKVEY